MGVEVKVEDLTKSFGKQKIWEGVSLTLPPGEISVLLGPSGTGKSVFLKHLIGLLRPNRGHVYVDGQDVPNLPERDLYEVRKLFGVLFQDGALFGSMNLYDNTAFPLREHTKKSESEIKKIVMEKLDIVGLGGAEDKLPGEISGGMRKRAGLARALVLDPEILLFDEPDSGLDPVRTAYLNQLIIDLNDSTGATILIVTHDVNTARTVPDNIGLLFQKHLAMFGPREMLLSSQEPVVRQFLNAQRQGPIGMSEEKDQAELEAEKDEEMPDLPPIPPQLMTSEGKMRANQRKPGEWLKENNVEPPPGSWMGEGDPKDFGKSKEDKKNDGAPSYGWSEDDSDVDKDEQANLGAEGQKDREDHAGDDPRTDGGGQDASQDRQDHQGSQDSQDSQRDERRERQDDGQRARDDGRAADTDQAWGREEPAQSAPSEPDRSSGTWLDGTPDQTQKIGVLDDFLGRGGSADGAGGRHRAPDEGEPAAAAAQPSGLQKLFGRRARP